MSEPSPQEIQLVPAQLDSALNLDDQSCELCSLLGKPDVPATGASILPPLMAPKVYGNRPAVPIAKASPIFFCTDHGKTVRESVRRVRLLRREQRREQPAQARPKTPTSWTSARAESMAAAAKWLELTNALLDDLS